MIVDSRNLPRNELVDLYHSAHGFLYPSTGEGFGWTLAEALLTGLPSVGTECSGHKDFFNSNYGYPVRHKRMRLATPAETTASDNKMEMYVATPSSIGNQMTNVMMHYSRALKRAKAGSDNIRENFTLNAFRDHFYEVMRRYC